MQTRMTTTQTGPAPTAQTSEQDVQMPSADDDDAHPDETPTLSSIRSVKGFKQVLDWKSTTDSDGKQHAIVQITSENLQGRAFWIKLSTLLGVDSSAGTTLEQNKSVFAAVRSNSASKEFAPLFSHAVIELDNQKHDGIICALDFSSEQNDHYGVVFVDGGMMFASKDEIENTPYGISSIKSLVHMCSLIPLSVKHLRINSILGWNTTSWRINRETFEAISKVHGPFNVDACCNQNGSL